MIQISSDQSFKSGVMSLWKYIFKKFGVICLTANFSLINELVILIYFHGNIFKLDFQSHLFKIILSQLPFHLFY